MRERSSGVMFLTGHVPPFGIVMKDLFGEAVRLRYHTLCGLRVIMVVVARRRLRSALIPKAGCLHLNFKSAKYLKLVLVYMSMRLIKVHLASQKFAPGHKHFHFEVVEYGGNHNAQQGAEATL